MGGNCESWKAPGDTELPSGYLTGSVPILLTDNCHLWQAAYANKAFNINKLRPHKRVSRVKTVLASTPSSSCYRNCPQNVRVLDTSFEAAFK